MTTAATTAAPTATKSARDVEDLVRDHLPVVGHLVRELTGKLPAHVNRDDLTSAGMAALVTAAQSYDAERGTPFARFAATRIRGALLDELRGLDWASRSVRRRARQVDTARQQLTAALGRTPTAEELAATLSVTVAEIESVEEDVDRAVVLSLQGFAQGVADDMITEPEPNPEELLLHRERLGYLHQAIEALPERLRLVVTDYFLNERPMAEIAAQLGVTESRISQLRAEALVLLRDGLNAQLEPGLVTAAERPEGCVAKRREAYYAAIATSGDLSSRLAVTTPRGMPLARVG